MADVSPEIEGDTQAEAIDKARKFLDGMPELGRSAQGVHHGVPDAGSRLPGVDRSLIEAANSPTAILKKVEEIGLDRGNECIFNLGFRGFTSSAGINRYGCRG